MKTIVSIRSDVRTLKSENRGLDELDFNMRAQLSNWFSAGILELRRITYDSTPASIIETIAKKESVHPLQSLEDLRSRLGGGRRCFGFFHPSLPDEPLVFIHCALVPTMASTMQEIHNHTGTESSDPAAAIFYSINSTQPGLAGVDLGNFLIKRVAAQLATEFPSLDTFATLSPVPRFRRWFLNKTSQEGKFAPTPEYIFGDDAAMAKFLDCCQGASRPLPPSTSPISHLVSVLEDNENKWYESPELVEALGPILTKLAAKYLVLEKHRGKPVDGVSKFHLSNGAELHRINFLANQTRKGYQTSYGIMVNYLYGDSKSIDDNHLSYINNELVVSDTIKALFL
ncbi:hypothetical protein TrRE_jg7569 [Triparma retinervis]|uniref:Malonyl-CoA decarboxylase C-terminal domain-containing protein n=1 Tax=Triparma retinervis TaxID=2557542 RepID=A0A9W7AK27_9STRA|nr:hypothetical protein TrRE_jg7569 [Triparma retinervis]